MHSFHARTSKKRNRAETSNVFQGVHRVIKTVMYKYNAKETSNLPKKTLLYVTQIELGKNISTGMEDFWMTQHLGGTFFPNYLPLEGICQR
jgi:hypothetical protein